MQLNKLKKLIYPIICIFMISAIANMLIVSAETTYTVSDEDSLILELENALDGDTIKIENDISLTTVLSITKSITLTADQPVIISAASGLRHMNVSGTNTAITFKNIILDGHTSSTGSNTGGINSDITNIRLNNPVIRNCKSANGGAIFNIGELNISGGIISGNFGVYAAGIYGSTVNLFGDAIVSDNSATNNGGGIVCTTIHVYDTAKIKNNTSDNSGGGIFARNITIGGDSEISGNEAKGNGVSTGFGGGICMNASGTANIYGSAVISGNKSAAGGGIAIFGLGNAGTINIYGSAKIIKNESNSSGGGINGNIINVSGDVIISENKTIVTGGGGGIYATGAVDISGFTEISKNEAKHHGGGIYNTANDITINIKDNAKINNNKSYANYGGGICIAGINVILNVFGSSEISYNEILGISSYGGGVGSSNSSATINVYGFAKIKGNKSLLTGGGIDMPAGSYTNGTTNIFDSAEISDNEAKNGGGIYSYRDINLSGSAKISSNKASGYGGGIFTTSAGGNINASDSAQINNNEAKYGGGIFINTTGTVTLSGSVAISGNKVPYDGGGIYINDITKLAAAPGTSFSNNSAGPSYTWRLGSAGMEELTQLHYDKIKTTSFTNPFTNAYNNYDVNLERVITPLNPIIEGLQDLTMMIGSSFDPMEGVKAYDMTIDEQNPYGDTPKDITADIEIYEGTVDVNTLGSYLLKYRVTSPYGLEATGERMIFVVSAESPAEPPVISSPDEKQLNDENPKTGDTSFVYMIVFCLPLVILCLLWRLKAKNKRHGY